MNSFVNKTLDNKSHISDENKSISKNKVPDEIDIDFNNYEVPNIFTNEDIDNMRISFSAVTYVYPKLDLYFRKKFGVIFDSNMLIATSEFNINNLDFLSNRFSFPKYIIVKLLNCFMTLLNLRERPDQQMNSTFESKNIYSMHGSQKNIIKNKESEIDFSKISKRILLELKISLIKSKLIKEDALTNIKIDKQNYKSLNKSDENDIPFYLAHHELNTILNYLNTFYFPFIRLYYHFINIEQITINKKIEIVIEIPKTVPPLSDSVPQIISQYNIEDEFLLNKSSNYKIVSSFPNSNNFKKFTNMEDEEEDLDEIKEDWKDIYSGLNMNKNLFTVESNEEDKLDKVKDMLNIKIDNVMNEVNTVMEIKQRPIENKILEVEKMMKPPNKK